MGIILEEREEQGGEREIEGRMEDVMDKTEAKVAGEKEEEGRGGRRCVTARAGENVEACDADLSVCGLVSRKKHEWRRRAVSLMLT